jgi:hypothetical protein
MNAASSSLTSPANEEWNFSRSRKRNPSWGGRIGGWGPSVGKISDEGVDRLALVGHKGGDADERRNLGMRTRLGDDGATIGVAYEDDRLARRINCPLGDGTSSASESVGFWTTLTL